MKVIITGATGMVGQGVLLECIESPEVTSVLVVNRRPIELQHAKIKEVIHNDLSDISAIEEQLKGFDACFFCLGVSSLGLNEDQYRAITYDITLNFARTLLKYNPGIIFNYVSGLGTDSSETSRQMWARVKGKTENDLLNLPFRHATMFRPGIIIPEKGVKVGKTWYNKLYTLLKPFNSMLMKLSSVTSTSRVGKAMIKTALKKPGKSHLENHDINEIAEND